MKALDPFDCVPRISPALAERLIKTVREAMKLGISNFPCAPAITVHVWVGALDKEITNANDAKETIYRLGKAIAGVKEACP